ncbi:hypothetical protein QL285_043511 [Trifolium repens]|nr:hypothetical protein QL285_043511 [Trifolium repens]
MHGYLFSNFFLHHCRNLLIPSSHFLLMCLQLPRQSLNFCLRGRSKRCRTRALFGCRNMEKILTVDVGGQLPKTILLILLPRPGYLQKNFSSYEIRNIFVGVILRMFLLIFLNSFPVFSLYT